jgi:hypothetical protein
MAAAMRAQSLNALGQAYLLVGRDRVMSMHLKAPSRSRWKYFGVFTRWQRGMNIVT